MRSSLWRNIWMASKKFGLSYDDFPTILNNIAILLRVLTINIYKWKNQIHISFYIMTFISGSLYLYVYIISVVWMLFIRYGTAEIDSAILVFAVSWNNITCLTKFVFMKIYANEIKNTVDKFLQCDAQVMPGTRFAKNLRRNLRIVKKRASSIWISLMSIGVIYLAIPFFTPERKFSTDIFILYGLEPMVISPNYEIAMFVLTIGVGFGIYTMLAVAVYVIVVVGYNEAQIHALSTELQNVWNDSENFYNHIKHRVTDKINAVYIKEQIMNEFTRVRLRDVIKFHISNINLLQELNNEFSPTLAVEYGIIILTVIAGMLSGVGNSYLQLPYAFVQIFMNCLAGQRLIDACDNFTNSIYCCKWENFNRTNQRTILFMLAMSQKTLMLTAGGVAKLNFNCLRIIFKSSYSTYTTLKSVV